MGRSDNYYEQRLNEPSTPAVQPTQPAQPQRSVVEKTPEPHRFGDQEFRVNDPSLSEVERNLERAKEKAYTSYIHAEGRRSVWSRLPYAWTSSLYSFENDPFPSEEEYNSMSFLQKQEEMGKRMRKLAVRTITALPKVLAQAPVKLALTGAQAIESTYNKFQKEGSKVLGVEPKTIDVVPDSFTIPVLGKINGFRGTYQERREMGFSPFMAAVSATGETAGDAAISASLMEGIQSAFKPRLKTVSPTQVAEDIRPLKTVEVENARSVKGTELGKTGQSFEVAGQQTETTYLRISKEAASKYGGNANNTYLKITPTGEGMAEFSIVQIRKSLANKAVDYLKSKFGRGQVIEGKLGPELKMESTVVKYDPKLALSDGGEISTSPITKVKDANRAVNEANTQRVVEDTLAGKREELRLTNDRLLRNTKDTGLIPADATPEDMVIVYRAATNDIAVGDHVTLDKANADRYVGQRKDAQLKQIEVPIKDLVKSEGLNTEFIYAPEGQVQPFKGDEFAKNESPAFNYLEELKNDENYLITKKVSGDDEDRALARILQQKIDEGLVPEDVLNDFYQKAGAAIDMEAGVPLSPEDGVRGTHVMQFYENPKVTNLLDAKQKASEAPQKLSTDVTKTVMSEPVKGMQDKPVTSNQVSQIKNIADDRKMDDMMIQGISLSLTGKANVSELTQGEAYKVSETIRLFNNTKENLWGDNDMIVRPYLNPARYWMEAAERELKHPIYSQVYLPIETGFRLLKAFKQSWQTEARKVFGEYSSPGKVDERRAITRYLEGDKSSILKNDAFSEATKKDLVAIGEWLKDNYKDFFKTLEISSDRFFGQYSPQIRDRGGIFNLYKSEEVPGEIRPFYEYEREGTFNPHEDDALALFDIYTSVVGKKQFLHDTLEEAKKLTEQLPENLRAATNDYIQEKLGYQDKLSQIVNKFGQEVSKRLGDKIKIPENIFRQMIDYGMSTSYSGALGLPRIMPVFRNTMQVFLTSYPELGPQWLASGMKSFYKKGGLKEIKDKGFLVEMGVPYGGDLVSISERGTFGRMINYYKSFNETMMKPYASADINNRGITYWGVKNRFDHYWDQFIKGGIDWDAFEKGIDLSANNPTLQDIVRQKLGAGKIKPETVEEVRDLLITDLIDRTQFPYRKGTQSRLHYGLKGKLGLQFSQWTWEYVHTLKSWVSRGQWDKLIRWYAASAAIKRTWEEMTGVDVSKWVGTGPITGLPLGPLTNAAYSAIQAISATTQGMAEDVNQNWKDIKNTMKIYGGTPTGVGVQRWLKVKQSIDRFEAGQSVSPDPDKPFGLYSSTGKLLRWVDFNELLLYGTGFTTEEETQFRDKLNQAKKDQVDYQNKVNKAMNMLVDGKVEKFDKYVTENELYMGDIGQKMKSYNVQLDQRIFDNLPLPLKEKYFTVFYPQPEPNSPTQ